QSITLAQLRFDDPGAMRPRFLAGNAALRSGNEIFNAIPAFGPYPASSADASLHFSGPADIQVSTLGRLSAPLTSSAGLNLTGGGALSLTVANPGLGGAIHINGAQLTAQAGDATLGSAANALTLTNGVLLFAEDRHGNATPLATARTIN